MKFHQHTDKIFTVEDFLSNEACKAYIDLSEDMGYEKALSAMQQKPVMLPS